MKINVVKTRQKNDVIFIRDNDKILAYILDPLNIFSIDLFRIIVRRLSLTNDEENQD